MRKSEREGGNADQGSYFGLVPGEGGAVDGGGGSVMEDSLQMATDALKALFISDIPFVGIGGRRT